MPITSLTSFNLFQSCMRSEEVGKKEEQEEDEKEICDVPVNPITFLRFCGWIWLKDLI